MPDIWFDVDTAIAEAPINIAPLIDDTDFKSKEESVAYNQAGLDLVWNFVTCAGAFTQTAVTPTTGDCAESNYAWTNEGNGYYAIEIPASGGASINNDTEGFGWFSGFATGILPWRGPMIGFRRAAMNDLLVEGGTASTNLEDFFDGTGYAGGTAKLNVNVSTITNDAITAAAIANGAIDATAIATGAIDADAFAADAIVAATLATGCLTADAFAADAIVAATLATGVLTADAFAADAIVAATLNTGAITADAIAANAIASTAFAAGAINAAAIADGAIDAATFAAGAINAAAIADGAIDAATFAAGAINAAAIADGAIDAATFAAGAIDATAVANGAIDATAIATDAIDADALSADALTEIFTKVLTTALTESYASDGAAPTLAQAIFAIQQFLQERSVSNVTLTVNKLDGSTPAMTFTLNNSTAPTSITRAS